MKENYNKAVMAYIEAFEEIIEIDFEVWVGDDVGEIATFGDYFISFSDIKTVVDSEIKSDVFFEWYDFVLEFQEKSFVNLKTYWRRRADAMYEKGFAFNKDDYQKMLLYERIKK